MATDELQTRDRTEFGQRVLAARNHAKLTQKKLGELTELGQSAIAFLEAKAHASEKTWLIAQVCGVRSAWLAKGEGPMLESDDPLMAARHVAEDVANYQAPNNTRDFRTVAFTLADSLEQSGVQITVRQFLDLAEKVYRRLGGGG